MAAPQTIAQNLFSKAGYFFFPSKVEVCSADKSNAFGKITLRFSFLTDGSGSENQVTIVQGSVNCGNNRKAGERQNFLKKQLRGKKKERETKKQAVRQSMPISPPYLNTDRPK